MTFSKILVLCTLLLCAGLAGCSEDAATVSQDMSDITRIEPAAGHLMMDYLPEVLEEKPVRQKIALNLPEAIASPMWIQNAVSYEQQDKPKIVIVIDDLGLSRARATRTALLPGPVTMAFLPYADDLPEQAAFARQHGHELMVHMPMQPLRETADPGPNALLRGLGEDELLARIRQNLSVFDGYVGINNHMGSAFTQDRKGLETLMAELRKRDMLYLDSRTSATSLAEDIARDFNVATTGRDVFLDHVITEDFIQGALRRTEDHALRHGTAIAIGHPHDLTLDALEKWLPTLERKGFQIVPITAVMTERDPRIQNVHLSIN